jgi:hypothetical protein
MKTSGVVVSLCAIVALGIVVLAPFPMTVSAGPATQAGYDSDVSPDMRTLVSPDQYHSIVAELNVVARRLLAPVTIRRAISRTRMRPSR